MIIEQTYKSDVIIVQREHMALAKWYLNWNLRREILPWSSFLPRPFIDRLFPNDTISTTLMTSYHTLPYMKTYTKDITLIRSTYISSVYTGNLELNKHDLQKKLPFHYTTNNLSWISRFHIQYMKCSLFLCSLDKAVLLYTVHLGQTMISDSMN